MCSVLIFQRLHSTGEHRNALLVIVLSSLNRFENRIPPPKANETKSQLSTFYPRGVSFNRPIPIIKISPPRPLINHADASRVPAASTSAMATVTAMDTSATNGEVYEFRATTSDGRRTSDKSVTRMSLKLD